MKTKGLLLSIIVACCTQTAFTQGTDFTYQGFLTDGGAPANGVYDLQFTVYNALAAGATVGASTTVNDLSISNGLFTVTVSPGASVFDGSARWLEIAVRPGASAGSYTNVVPRQPILPTPYAIATGALIGQISAANVSNNFITATMLSSNTLTATQIASGAVGSDELADTIALGATNTNGRLDVYRTSAGTPAITLLGSSSQISTYGSDGLEQVRLWGASYGEILLNNSLANNATAVKLTAQGATGGQLDLRNTNGSSRAVLEGENTGGLLTLYAADGSIGSVLYGNEGAGSGSLSLRNTNGSARLRAYGGPSSGSMDVFDSDGTLTVELNAESGGGGQLVLRRTNGVSGATLSASVSSISRLTLYSTNGSVGASLVGNGDSYINSGNLGIGTSTPVSTLDVNGLVTASTLDVNGLATALRYNAATSTVASVSYGFASDPNTGLFSPGANTVAFATTGLERMRITSGGDVGIGRTPTANPLEVEGNASKTTAGSWLANSDARIKQDIQPVHDALATLAKVRPVSFRYTEDYRAQHRSVEDRRYLNVVAQEFQKVFPDDVKSSGEKMPDGSEILQVDTYPLTIYSAAAIQELNQKLTEELKKRDVENADLKARLEKLEQLLKQKPNGGDK